MMKNKKYADISGGKIKNIDITDLCQYLMEYITDFSKDSREIASLSKSILVFFSVYSLIFCVLAICIVSKNLLTSKIFAMILFATSLLSLSMYWELYLSKIKSFRSAITEGIKLNIYSNIIIGVERNKKTLDQTKNSLNLEIIAKLQKEIASLLNQVSLRDNQISLYGVLYDKVKMLLMKNFVKTKDIIKDKDLRINKIKSEFETENKTKSLIGRLVNHITKALRLNERQVRDVKGNLLVSGRGKDGVSDKTSKLRNMLDKLGNFLSSDRSKGRSVSAGKYLGSGGKSAGEERIRNSNEQNQNVKDESYRTQDKKVENYQDIKIRDIVQREVVATDNIYNNKIADTTQDHDNLDKNINKNFQRDDYSNQRQPIVINDGQNINSQKIASENKSSSLQKENNLDSILQQSAAELDNDTRELMSLLNGEINDINGDNTIAGIPLEEAREIANIANSVNEIGEQITDSQELEAGIDFVKIFQANRKKEQKKEKPKYKNIPRFETISAANNEVGQQFAHSNNLNIKPKASKGRGIGV